MDTLVSKRNKLSKVWSYFTRSTDKKTAKCNFCKKEYKTSGNTSNLSDHLKRTHKTEINAEPNAHDDDASSSSVSSSITPYLSRREYDRESFRRKQLDGALLQLITTDLQPFSIVEDDGFKAFVHALDPRYILPSKSTVRDKLLFEKYESGVSKLKEILAEIEFVAVTTDLWTSRNADGFMTITCHYVDNSYNLVSAVLCTCQIQGNHTGENIAAALLEKFQFWGIEHKIVTIVGDSAANMICACNVLKIKHFPCFAHAMNLVVQDAYKHPAVAGLIAQCKRLVSHFRHSNLAKEQLNKAQELLGMKQLKLLQECPTRWNSAFNMMVRVIEVADALTMAVSKLPNAPPAPSLEELRILKEFCEMLQCFEEATKKCSSERITGSLPIPITTEIYSCLTEMKPASSQGKALLEELIEGVKARLFPYEERTVSRLATLLDPRLRKEAFRSASNVQQSEILLQQEATRYHSKSPPQESQPSLSEDEPAKKFKYSFKFMAKKIEEKGKSPVASSIVMCRQYFMRANSTWDTNPLTYWQINTTDLPALEKCAKKYLCVPSTSVPAERVFSKCGLIVSEKRSRIKPKHVDKLVFLGHNTFLN